MRRERVTNPFSRLMGFFRGHLDLKHLPLMVGRAKMMEKTRLDETRPHNGLEFTEPGCHQLALRHIDVHKYLKEVETGAEMSYPDAAASWFDNVYMPVIELIRERGVLKHFPKNTEGDLYIWLVCRRENLEEQQQAMGRIPIEKVIWDLENEISSHSFLSMSTFFGQKLNLEEALQGVAA